MTGVSTYSLNSTLLSAALDAQTKLAAKQVQEATGLTSDTYSGLGTSASTVISLADEVAQAESAAENAATAAARVEAMYSALDDMNDILTTLRTSISAALSSSENVTLNAEAEAALEDLVALMNTQLNGRYLFSGSMTDTAAVDLDSYSYPTDTSTADTSYYQGDDTVLSVRTSDVQSVSYGVTADCEAFEQALRVASVLSAISTDPVDTDTLEDAYELATEAIESLTTVQSQLSVTSDRLERVQETQEEFISYTQAIIDDIKNVDVAEVALEVTQYETLLQAAYSAIADLDDLHLVNYL